MDSLCVAAAKTLPYHLQISTLRKEVTPQARQSHVVSSTPKGEPGLCWAVHSRDPGPPDILLGLPGLEG